MRRSLRIGVFTLMTIATVASFNVPLPNPDPGGGLPQLPKKGATSFNVPLPNPDPGGGLPQFPKRGATSL